jgi:hypothetical protein
MSYRNPTMTDSQLRAMILKNLSAIFDCSDSKEKFMCNGLWITTGLLLVPKHVIPKGEVRWKIVDTREGCSESPKVVTPSCSLGPEHGDWAVVSISSRSKRNLIPYFSSPDRKLEADFVWRSPETLGIDVDFSQLPGHLAFDERHNKAQVIMWKWPSKTFLGACGGVYLSRGANPGILGIHVGGDLSDLSIGMSYCPTQQQLSDVLVAFANKPGFVFSAEQPSSIARSVNGSPTFSESKVLPDRNLLAATEWLKAQESTPPIQNQGASYAGVRPSSAFYKSRAVDTIIADSVRKLWPEAKFGKPRFGRSMWARSARFSFDTTPGMPLEDLEWAYLDYMTKFQIISPFLKQHLRPLTWDEILNGIPAVRFIDAMNWSSSMGINFPGGKGAWTIEYIDNDTGYFKKDFLNEVKHTCDEALERLTKGERVNWLFNATPKDEPTPLTKEKVRLFMVAEISCTILVRKYFTPVCRIIQMLTGVSECAVGINCSSPDWEHMMNHLERFSNLFDGDHSKYDLRKNPTLSRFSYRIMLDIAALGEYTSFDLFIMSTMVDDLVSPLVNFNGEVYQMDGSTPSGIPVTVIINSLDNSLINRCAYHSVYPRSLPGSFRRFVSHVNYGDDFVNSVSYYARKFNFLSLKKYMEKYGMVLTPGDKTAVGKAFMTSTSDVVFLKRSSISLPELDYRIGKLDEASIVKSLTCVLASKALSPELAAATNIDGALREWAFHGKKVYETRLKQMTEIAKEHGIAHLCRQLTASYEDILATL